jgi:hypothetical protein
VPDSISQPDLLEALFRRLVANIAALDPSALHRPVNVTAIAERLVPYRTHRTALGFDTNEDYELTILRLLAGEGGYAQVFPEDVAAAIVDEVRGVNPDPGLFRQFPDATFLLDPDRIAELTEGRGARPAARPDREPVPPDYDEPPAYEPGLAGRFEVSAGGEADDDAAAEPSGDETDLPFALDDSEEAASASPREVLSRSAQCSYCGGGLPVGRTVLFCPHCGQNIGVVHCPTCGSELDVGWEFCITCGRKVTGLG